MSYVLFEDITEDYSPEITSQIILRDYSKEVSEEPGYIAVFAFKKSCSWTSRRLLLITKTRHLKLMILVLFCIWEGAKDWAYWNYSFDMHLKYLGPVSCFSPSWIPLRTHRQGVAAVADGLVSGNIPYLLEWQATFFVHTWSKCDKPCELLDICPATCPLCGGFCVNIPIFIITKLKFPWNDSHTINNWQSWYRISSHSYVKANCFSLLHPTTSSKKGM